MKMLNHANNGIFTKKVETFAFTMHTQISPLLTKLLQKLASTRHGVAERHIYYDVHIDYNL